MKSFRVLKERYETQRGRSIGADSTGKTPSSECMLKERVWNRTISPLCTKGRCRLLGAPTSCANASLVLLVGQGDGSDTPSREEVHSGEALAERRTSNPSAAARKTQVVSARAHGDYPERVSIRAFLTASRTERTNCYKRVRRRLGSGHAARAPERKSGRKSKPDSRRRSSFSSQAGEEGNGDAVRGLRFPVPIVNASGARSSCGKPSRNPGTISRTPPCACRP